MLFLGLEFLATSVGETIEFSAPSGVADAPLGLNPATPLQAVERRIKRALFQGKAIIGNDLRRSKISGDTVIRSKTVDGVAIYPHLLVLAKKEWTR